MAAVLCADDYALTDGVSRGIEELARAGRLSATSALVTTRHWPEHARRVLELRRHIQVGLHLNLTLGQPLAPMPKLAPDGRFPTIGHVIKLALAGRIDTSEIEHEVARQIAKFMSAAGVAPDFVDGHQHVHALPGVRRGVIAALRAAFPNGKPWIRDPADGATAIVARRAEPAKALVLASLAGGFGAAVRCHGFRTNAGFAGVSRFNRAKPFAEELTRFFAKPGPAHLIMCHPGHVDPELTTLDPVVDRREDEYATLARQPDLPALIMTGGAGWWGPRGGLV